MFGTSNPILSISPSDSVIIPVTAVFEDIDSSLSYDMDSESSVAKIQYTYHGIPVGSATVELADNEPENTFDFENQMENEEEISEPEEELPEKDNKIIFINVRKVIVWIIGIAGFLILLFVIKAIIDNYQFAKRRKERVRHKKRKKFPSEFDDFDF